ncbi:kinesin-like protein KIF28P isoform X2 [Coturnix japonica]|uniref:kinesin-like protein KIF28P isoform X2 n=1 Tax=Coturnix japonica TaxID=93934 RepID=UPI000776CC63|nr:kinesin-like protein KIF28P isoform X2 [Coturnix japonica]
MPSADSVKVAVRVRPFSQREKDAGSRCVVSMESNSTSIYDPRNPGHVKTFTFDLAYWSHSGFLKDESGMLISAGSNRYAGQREVFRDLGQGVLQSAWQGYNATLLAYGQTGSGKSYSMIGYGANRGLVPSVCEELCKAIQSQEKNKQYQITFSMLEIYNEQVIDLLSKTRKPGGLKIREDQQQGFYVDGLKLVPCDNYAQIERLMDQGNKMRTTATTTMNASSSRSHMVITIQFKQIFLDEAITKQSVINLVDLAGSERQKSSGSEKDRLKEGTRVNLSLTTLGNVISALAEVATGRKVLHIPYRDSVLTKLLQSALGGNSRTIMIAALSPADICYEETLSTLRYAERAKRIRNKAVVNASPTEKLIRELKAENNKILSRMSGLGSAGRSISDEAQLRLLAESEGRTQSAQVTWEARLEETRHEWEQQYSAMMQERWMMEMFPYLLNINEDPQLSWVLKHFIQDGTCDVGQSASNAIILRGLGILDKHATFTNADGKVTLAPQDKCKVVVNGVTITGETELQHLDRVILGSNSAYLYVGPPAQRTEEDLSRYDYDFFQSELAAAEGFSVNKLGTVGSGQDRPDPSVLAVFHDYIKLMPLVEEANQMSQELRKDLKFELKVKNLALSDSRGHDLQKEITVKVTHETTQQVWVWSKAKFINRKFLMEELYQRFLEGEDAAMNQDSDPFWDPVEAVHVGSAHVWLQALAYRVRLEERAELLNSEGLEEAVVLINLSPCSSDGRLFGEDEMVIDPLELLERRVDFQIHIAKCLGVKWLRGAVGRGIQIGYRVYDLPRCLYTKPVWGSVNPKIEETVHFSALNASYEFLHYLQKNALIVDLWGLQEGCTEMDSSLDGLLLTAEGTVVVDNPKALTASSAGLDAAVEVPELYRKLLQMEQETELLRELNRALREENTLLKGKLKKWDTGHHEKKKSESPTKAVKVMKQSASSRDAEETCSHRTSCDAELARALKTFYQNMSVVRQQFLQLKDSRPPVSLFLLLLFAIV